MKPKWQRKLKASEIEHIRLTTFSGTLAQFKANRAGQIAHPDHGCSECRHIALKLGIEK